MLRPAGSVLVLVEDSNDDKLPYWKYQNHSYPLLLRQSSVYSVYSRTFFCQNLAKYVLSSRLTCTTLQLCHWLYCKPDTDGCKWAVLTLNDTTILLLKQAKIIDHKTHHKSSQEFLTHLQKTVTLYFYFLNTGWKSSDNSLNVLNGFEVFWNEALQLWWEISNTQSAGLKSNMFVFLFFFFGP